MLFNTLQGRLESGPSNDTFDFNDPDSWLTFVWSSINEFGSANVIEAFLEAPPEYVVGDNLSWLEDILERVSGIKIDAKLWFVESLRRKYNKVRAMHGTRTASVSSFYGSGILPLNGKTAAKIVKRVFNSDRFPELSSADIERAIGGVRLDYREGWVFFNTGEELYPDRFGNYLLYGSEYICAVAAHLPKHRDYRQILKLTGKPTLFLCDIPISLIDNHIMGAFAGDCLAMAFQYNVLNQKDCFEENKDFSISITEPLPPSAIVGHYHPGEISDPISMYRVF